MSSPFSPTESQSTAGDFEPPPITRRATIGDPVGDNAVARQKRKTTVTACDRCRRRKIRCDGERPCHTCARFGVRCSTTEHRRERSASSTAETAALADRVRLLEARLAASEQQGFSSSNTPFHNNPSNQSGPPSLRLDTNIGNPDFTSNFGFNDDMTTDETPMTDDMMGLSVPTIQITGPHGTAPPSPALLSPNSPAPSLFSGTSNASTPDMLAATSAWNQFDSNSNTSFPLLSPTPQHFDRTPPVSQWAEVYDQTALLRTPGTHSRRSSISSFGGLPESFCAINLDFRSPSPQPPWSDNASQPQHHQPGQQQQYFDLSISDHQDFATSDPIIQIPQSAIPSKPHADYLAEQVFSTLPIPLEKTALKICLEYVYASDGTSPAALGLSNLSNLTPYTPRVARCLVFLVLTIGYHLVGSEEGAEGCYREVVETMKGREVWAESGARDVVELLRVLTEVSCRGGGGMG